MVSVPVLLSAEVNVPSTPMPRPDAPVTLMVMSPPLWVKSPSALKPAAYDKSVASLVSTAPLAFNV